MKKKAQLSSTCPSPWSNLFQQPPTDNSQAKLVPKEIEEDKGDVEEGAMLNGESRGISTESNETSNNQEEVTEIENINNHDNMENENNTGKNDIEEFVATINEDTFEEIENEETGDVTNGESVEAENEVCEDEENINNEGEDNDICQVGKCPFW